MTPEEAPPFEDPLSADERPMRRELIRQIAALELKLSSFRRDQAPFEQLPELPQRGPALLSAELLERVRDELLEQLDVLHRRVVRRFADEIVDPPDGP